MPTYDYLCPANNIKVEVLHGMDEKVLTWGELCLLAGVDAGDTPFDAPVQKMISAPSLAFPKTTSELKNLGFTKLVKREKGVYENITAGDQDSRYMYADKPETMPNLSKTISD